MNKLLKLIIERLSLFGKVPLCNGIVKRAPHIFGFCFPLCYRCTFLFIFFFITLFVCYRRKIKINLYIACLCLFPMIIDGGIQTFFGIMSHNLRRMITGGLFGFGLGVIVTHIYMYLDQRC